MNKYSVILASGAYTSGRIIPTSYLLETTKFLDEEGVPAEITPKNLEPMGVESRLYTNPGEVTSDIGAIALKKCFESSKIDPSLVKMVIVAHNTGDNGEIISPISYKVASKAGLSGIQCYDVTEGCQGWCRALRIGNNEIKTGFDGYIAVVGAEQLSPIRGRKFSSLLFADGAGAVILGGIESETPTGIVSSHNGGMPEYNQALKMRKYDNPENIEELIRKQIDMDGYTVYDKATQVIPETLWKLCEQINITPNDVNFILKHQASEKILSRSSLNEVRKMMKGGENQKAYLEQYRRDKVPNSCKRLGNSSVATIPTLLDLLLKKKADNPDLNILLEELAHYKIEKDDILAVIGVGAGLGWGGHLIKMHELYWQNLK